METGEIAGQIGAIINRVVFLERRRRFVFEGTSLYPSEIHLMLETKGDQAVNATRMADRLGVTKGAVSQTLTRLEKKGIIEKTKDPGSRNELSVTLTPSGKRAYDRYRTMHDSVAARLQGVISGYAEHEQRLIERFLADLRRVIERL